MTDLGQYLDMRRRLYVINLSPEDLRVTSILPQADFEKKLNLLVSRRAGEGELDIFCGYFRDDFEVKAVYLSLHPGFPVMLLGRETVEARIRNLRFNNLPCEQSLEAVTNWPQE